MKSLTLEINNKIGIVTFERPPVNAVNYDGNIEIAELFESINERDDIECVIFRSIGKGFISGSDVSDFDTFSDETLGTYEDANVRTIESIYKCKVPVIGLVQGYCLGLGVCIASVCDMIIAADDAYFGLPEVTIAVVGGTGSLSLLAPEKFVRYMAYTGKRIGVEKIAEFGSIHQIVSRDELLDAGIDLAKEITENYTKAVQAVKGAIHEVKQHDHAREFYADCEYTHKMLKDPKRDEVLAGFKARKEAKKKEKMAQK